VEVTEWREIQDDHIHGLETTPSAVGSFQVEDEAID